MNFVEEADNVITNGSTPKVRVFSWLCALLVGAFGAGATLVGFVGLPSDVSVNNQNIGIVFKNQVIITNLIADQQCRIEELTFLQCNRLKARFLSDLEAPQ